VQTVNKITIKQFVNATNFLFDLEGRKRRDKCHKAYTMCVNYYGVLYGGSRPALKKNFVQD